MTKFISAFSILTVSLLSQSPLAFAQSDSIECVLAHPQSCHQCQNRIMASCGDNQFSGALDKSLIPTSVVLQVSNPSNGTERLITVEKNSLKLGALESQRSLQDLVKKSKAKIQKNETVRLASIKIPTSVALYKDTKGTEIAAQLKPVSAQRNIASENSESAYAGALRAQKTLGKDQK